MQPNPDRFNFHTMIPGLKRFTIIEISMSISSRDEENNYDWRGNCGKWRGLLSSSLSRVLYQVHPTLMAQGEALDYVEGLILRLLAMLTTKPTPITVSDVSDRVSRTFPTPIDKWALNEAQGALSRGAQESQSRSPSR
ncbi:SOS [Lepeophtheirus salmonis]|uniref:SOS n=1 Tax=Lepeophtheirus salmonis TaxID=72036 RepID=A0A7R8HDV5_LEPSM|nr:SOS [Lepeophtheirus salmonis]CAF3042458.1 SOS [Lepeophtheirus salmonis]